MPHIILRYGIYLPSFVKIGIGAHFFVLIWYGITLLSIGAAILCQTFILKRYNSNYQCKLLYSWVLWVTLKLHPEVEQVLTEIQKLLLLPLTYYFIDLTDLFMHLWLSSIHSFIHSFCLCVTLEFHFEAVIPPLFDTSTFVLSPLLEKVYFSCLVVSREPHDTWHRKPMR